MKRETVVSLTLNAFTLDECLAAEEALTHWLAKHPDDLGLYELAGQLGIVTAAAREREEDRYLSSSLSSVKVPVTRR